MTVTDALTLEERRRHRDLVNQLNQLSAAVTAAGAAVLRGRHPSEEQLAARMTATREAIQIWDAAHTAVTIQVARDNELKRQRRNRVI